MENSLLVIFDEIHYTQYSIVSSYLPLPPPLSLSLS